MLASELQPLLCGTCNITFAMKIAIFEFMRDSKMPVHCPNGHSNHFDRKEPKPQKDLVSWIKKAPHLDTCNIHVNRECDCGKDKLLAP